MQPLIIKTADFLPYTIAFQQPFVVKGKTLCERRFFYLNLKTSDGHTAVGEIAPLENRSPENQRRVVHDLKEVCSWALWTEVPGDLPGLISFLRADGSLKKLCASVRFGIESALFMLAATAAGKTLTEFLSAPKGHQVKTAALLQGAHAQVLADGKRLREEGYKVFKLKVGDRNIPLDVKKVSDIRKLLSADGFLRLDANGQWSLEEACLFCQLAGPEKIEFIEDPLKDMAQLDRFYKQTHMPVALDETLSSSLGRHEAVYGYVLKPMILGGIVVTLDWIKEAQRHGKKAIISSCFESSVGLKVLESLSCLTGAVAGLGTQRWFKE